MFGIDIWFIHQDRCGKRYYYKGTEGGRRFWTTRQRDAHFFTEKTDAVLAWELLDRAGVITGRTL